MELIQVKISSKYRSTPASNPKRYSKPNRRTKSLLILGVFVFLLTSTNRLWHRFSVGSCVSQLFPDWVTRVETHSDSHWLWSSQQKRTRFMRCSRYYVGRDWSGQWWSTLMVYPLQCQFLKYQTQIKPGEVLEFLCLLIPHIWLSWFRAILPPSLRCHTSLGPSLRLCEAWDVASCTCGGEDEGPQRVAMPLDVKPELQQGNGGVITITSFHSAAGKETDKNTCGHTHKLRWYKHVNELFINI